MLNERLEKVIADALTALDGASEQGKAVANAAPHVRGGVAAFGAGPADVAGTTPVQREVDWHERERLLKLAFPLDLHTTTSSSEIQFGYVTRPTHANTSWDAAKFETATQRWVHVAEGSYGVAVVNKGTYGHDISRPPAGESRSSLPTTVRLSLVRGPMYPHPLADEGKHTFECSLLVGDIGDATREGYAKALPLRLVAAPFDPVVTCSNPDVVVSACQRRARVRLQPWRGLGREPARAHRRRVGDSDRDRAH